MFGKSKSNSFSLIEEKKKGLTESEYALNVTTIFISAIYAFYKKKDLKEYSSDLNSLSTKLISLRGQFSEKTNTNKNLLMNNSLYSDLLGKTTGENPIEIERKNKSQIITDLNSYAKPNNSFHKILICICFIASLSLLYPLFHYGQSSSLFSCFWGGCIGFFISGLYELITFTNLFYRYRFFTRIFSNFFRFTSYNLSELISSANTQLTKIDYSELTSNASLAILESVKTNINLLLQTISENPNSPETLKAEINKLKDELFEKINKTAEDVSENFFLAMGDVSNPASFLNKKSMEILLNCKHPAEEKEFMHIIKNHKFWKALNSLCDRISENSSLCMNADQFAYVFFRMYEHFFNTKVPKGNNQTYQVLFGILKEGKFVTDEVSTVRNKLVLYKKNKLPFPWSDGTEEKNKPEEEEAGIKMKEILKGMGIEG